MVAPIAQFVVSLGLDGRVVSQGTMSEAMKEDSRFAKEVAKNEEQIEKEDEVVALEGGEKEEKKPSGKLMTAEEKAEGHVAWPASSF
jgi:hypothetical protein